MTQETSDIISNYVKAIKENNAVVFVGTGMSVDSGFFDWKKLLEPIAKRLGLDINEEYDLTALAQYFVDKEGGREELNQVLVEHYHNLNVKLSAKHKILARLPTQIFWTTNFDNLIERALVDAGKTPDVKKAQDDLSINLPKRDSIVYKMHGDISSATPLMKKPILFIMMSNTEEADDIGDWLRTKYPNEFGAMEIFKSSSKGI